MSYGIYQLQPDVNNLSQLSVVTMPGTSNRVGGVKQGANVTIASDGTISVAAPGTGPQGPKGDTGAQGPSGPVVPATATSLGGVKIGSGVNVAADGTITVPGAPMTWG